MASSTVVSSVEAFEFDLTSSSCEISRLLMSAIDCVDYDRMVAVDFIRKASLLLKAMAGRERGASKQGGLAPWQIKRVEQMIEDRISETISLDELARTIRLSTSYFSTAFKVSFGMSPHNYILSRRIGHAKLRMIESDAPLCEIALDCGLADQAHLCRVFRRITGTTPSSWRRLAAHPDASDAASLRSAA